MKNQTISEPGESRASIINAAKTPLGFFVLVVLFVEVFLGATVGLGQSTDRTLALKGMLGIIGALISVVAVIAFFRPKNLQSQTDTASSPSVTPNQQTNITGTYHAGIDHKYKVKISRLTGDYYRVYNPDDWEGVGFFDGDFYYGVFKMNDRATPIARRGNWGSHRAKILANGSFDLFGIELKDKSEFARFDGDGWNRESVGE